MRLKIPPRWADDFVGRMQVAAAAFFLGWLACELVRRALPGGCS